MCVREARVILFEAMQALTFKFVRHSARQQAIIVTLTASRAGVPLLYSYYQLFLVLAPFYCYYYFQLLP